MKALVGGVVAFVLLMLYAASVIVAIWLVVKGNPKPNDAFTEGCRLAMTTIGALVSSLVISVLAATGAGDVPLTQTMIRQQFSKGQITAAQLAIFAYLAVWLVSGLSAFVVGVMLYPDVLQSLTDHGKAWIGLAVATGYAYFGLKPSNG